MNLNGNEWINQSINTFSMVLSKHISFISLYSFCLNNLSSSIVMGVKGVLTLNSSTTVERCHE